MKEKKKVCEAETRLQIARDYLRATFYKPDMVSLLIILDAVDDAFEMRQAERKKGNNKEREEDDLK